MNRSKSNIYHQLDQTIYVDESGDAGTKSFRYNKKFPYFIMGFCYCKKPAILKRGMHRVLLQCHKSGIYPTKLNEIKFYPTTELKKLGYTTNEIKTSWEPNYSKIRDMVLRVILDCSDGVFAGIIDKNTIVPRQQSS